MGTNLSITKGGTILFLVISETLGEYLRDYCFSLGIKFILESAIPLPHFENTVVSFI